MEKPPETDPVAPVHPTVRGAPEPRQLPPRSVTGTWLVELIDDEFPATITRVVVRHTDLLMADVTCNEVPMLAHIKACGCCGRPWVVGLYTRQFQSPNMASMWNRDKRLAIGSAAYGIAYRAALRGTDNPEQRHALLNILPPKP